MAVMTERRVRERRFRVDVPMRLDTLVAMLTTETGMPADQILVNGMATWVNEESDDELMRRENAESYRRRRSDL